MPVACARATGATPATAAATSNATSRPMACLKRNRERETGYPGSSPSFRHSKRDGPPASGRAARPAPDLEPNAARKNESLPAAEFAASLCEWDQVRAPHSERGAAEHV